MKAFITFLSLCLFSTIIHASEVTSLGDIKDLEGQTLELKIDMHDGTVADLSRGDQFCVIMYMHEVTLKKGTLITVESVKTHNGFLGMNVGAVSPFSTYADAVLVLSGINDQGKKITFKMQSGSSYGPLLSTHKVKSDVVQMINNLFEI